jgi:hypothetical protein
MNQFMKKRSLLKKSFYYVTLSAVAHSSFALRPVPAYGASDTTSEAWQIKGKVTDINGNAIAAAQICVTGSTANCVASAANGTFSISGSSVVPVRYNSAVQLSAKGITVDCHNGKLFLYTPGGLRGNVELFNANGSRLAAINNLALSSGTSSLNLPMSRLGSTMHFLRLSSGGMQMTWEIVLGEVGVSSAFARRYEVAPTAVEAAVVTPLSAPVTIVASKTGYTSRNYYAITTPDTLSWIILALVGDDSTYKAPGASYPASAIPPNVLFGQATCYACASVYSGKKVGELLGYGVSNCCGAITFNNVWAPKDSNYLMTLGYMCSGGDNDGDATCGGQGTNGGLGCRPMQFAINGDTVKSPNGVVEVWQIPCTNNPSWCIHVYDTITLPLKAGLNSMHLWSSSSDMPDLDRIIIKDGRTY